jgi:hypothetical protein
MRRDRSVCATGRSGSSCYRLRVTKHEKLVGQILAGRSSHNIPFESLRTLLLRFGFLERIRGDHHIFSREGVGEILNLQPLPSGKAKSYQVRQVRTVIVRYQLAETEDGN